MEVSKSILINKENLKKVFNNSSDLILYEFDTLSEDGALVAYINGIIDKSDLNDNLLKPLMMDLISIWDFKSTIYKSGTIEITHLEDSVLPITNGSVLLFLENLDFAYIFNFSKWEKRTIDTPPAEMVIRGPKRAFIEDIGTNKTLIRRIIKNNDLVFEEFIIGQQTNTSVTIAYIDGIVIPDVLNELRNRLKKIEVDAILDNEYIEEYIEDRPIRLISTVGFTERPDVAAARILEGNVAILCDGSPNALTVPKLFIENLHSPEDYYTRPKYATFLRFIRLVGFFISFVFPGIYVSLLLYHQEMIPTNLLISIAGQREGVPFSTTLEAFFLIMFFELLKESALRLPNAVGEAVTLVGGLVIGQAAVDAGIVSATMIIVVAATGMAEFVVPAMREVIPIYRLIFLFLGSVAGLYGISMGLIFLLIFLVSMKSFGVPYMWPIAPYDRQGMKDSIIRFPIRRMTYRPGSIAKEGSKSRHEEISKK